MEKKKTRYLVLFVALCISFGLKSCENWTKDAKTAGNDWADYLGDPGRSHYSTLNQIDSANVKELEVAWVYNTGDFGEMQCNLIEIRGVLFGTTAAGEAFALDATTGTEKWRYAPEADKNFLKSRGVAFWEKDTLERILFTYDEWLYALDARTGSPVASFGEMGRVSLKSGLGDGAKDKYVMSRTPGTVFGNLIIMPLVVTRLPGYIQAFNIETGKLEWVFHTIPKPGEYGSETWPKGYGDNENIGGANSWAGMALDEERGIIYIPTGSAHSPGDFWGGNRKGENLFANTLLALNAKTGERIWHFQFVHHDLLDRDLPAPPTLATITRDGKVLDVVVQTTKTGQVFLFERDTGKPVYPIEEMPFPASEIEGEEAWPTQPIALIPKPFSRQSLTIEEINPHSIDKDSLSAIFRNSKVGMYTPLSETPTIVFPGYDGGAEWGGVAVSPDGMMFVNANEMAWVSTLSPTGVKKEAFKPGSIGKTHYLNSCSMCHGTDLSGNPASGFPALENLGNRMDKNSLSNIISKGKGMMPGFPGLSKEEKDGIISFLFNEEKIHLDSGTVENKPTADIPWKFNGFKKFLDSDGLPAISPPWGTFTAIDLNTGSHSWQVVLGEDSLMHSRGVAQTGTENYGGPLLTSSGLLFIAATRDGKFRAFDKSNGQLLWETTLPAAGFATPSTYEAGGKQFVVIACGGTKLNTNKGDAIVAFALPEE